MRFYVSVFLASACWVCGLSAEAGASLDSITTTKGVRFDDVHVLSKSANDVIVRHSGGLAKIPRADLPNAIAEMLWESASLPAPSKAIENAEDVLAGYRMLAAVRAVSLGAQVWGLHLSISSQGKIQVVFTKPTVGGASQGVRVFSEDVDAFADVLKKFQRWDAESRVGEISDAARTMDEVSGNKFRFIRRGGVSFLRCGTGDFYVDDIYQFRGLLENDYRACLAELRKKMESVDRSAALR